MGKAKKSPDEMTFLEHLEDLRKRLFYSFVAIFIVVIPAWFFSKQIFEVLSKPVTQFLPEGIKMAYTSLTAPFMLYIKVAFLAALFITSPFIFLQLWYFIAPGLYQKEKKYVVPFVLFTTVFFLMGAAFGYPRDVPLGLPLLPADGLGFRPGPHRRTVLQLFPQAPPGDRACLRAADARLLPLQDRPDHLTLDGPRTSSTPCWPSSSSPP